MIELKKIIGTAFILLTGFIAFAQGPSLSPYDLKESYLEKRASFERSSTKKIGSDQQKELDRIVTILAENAPNSYEYHFVKYINGNFNTAFKDNLFEAYRLKPDAREVRKEMFGYYALTGNKGKQKELARTLKNSYSTNTKAYYKSLVSSTQITTIFVSGEADAYPLLILQSLGEIRSNIEIVNLDFLQNDSYRKAALQKWGASETAFVGNESSFMKAAMRALKTRAFISSTISQAYLSQVGDFCFLTGLHYQYSCPDQKKALTEFWNKAKGELAAIKLENSTERRLYGNYLPPLLTLYKLKLVQNEKDSALRAGILILAEKVGKETAVEGILKEYEQNE